MNLVILYELITWGIFFCQILTDPPHMEPTEKYNMLKHIYGLATAIILAKSKSLQIYVRIPV